MWNRREIKARGKAAFKANYWPCVLVALLLLLFFGSGAATGARVTINQDVDETTQEQLTQEQEQAVTDVTEAFESLTVQERRIAIGTITGILGTFGIIGVLLKIFVFNPLQVGCYRFFRKNAVDPTTGVGVIGEGFGSFGHVFLTLFLRDLFILLWSVLLVIPGVMKAYSYTMVPFIIKDNPKLTAGQVLARSRDMMRGNRMKLFVMDLSFFGWALLSAVTFGLVAVFWANPYYQCSKAALYLELSGQGQGSGSHFRR